MNLSSNIVSIAIVGGALGLGACGGTQPEPATPETTVAATSEATAEASAAPSTVEGQIALGKELYLANCASCHGDAGQGVSAPPVVGEKALPLAPPEGAKFRKTEFKTAADVASFVVSSMPPGKGGSLTADQYLAILAFDLSANGVELKEVVTLEGAANIVLHP